MARLVNLPSGVGSALQRRMAPMWRARWQRESDASVGGDGWCSNSTSAWGHHGRCVRSGGRSKPQYASVVAMSASPGGPKEGGAGTRCDAPGAGRGSWPGAGRRGAGDAWSAALAGGGDDSGGAPAVCGGDGRRIRGGASRSVGRLRGWRAAGRCFMLILPPSVRVYLAWEPVDR